MRDHGFSRQPAGKIAAKREDSVAHWELEEGGKERAEDRPVKEFNEFHETLRVQVEEIRSMLASELSPSQTEKREKIF